MIVNIERATGRVADINQQYDERYFDNAAYPDGTIPADALPQAYMQNAKGDIVLRPVSVSPLADAVSKATTLEELKAAVLAILR